MVQLTDAATIESPRLTDDGYLVGRARVARTGIQEYLAGELGLTDRNETDIVRVYRPEEEVFSTDSLRSYAYRPVTSDHPSEPVTADNWKDYATGQTGPDVARDGEFVSVPMVLMDKGAIDEWKQGKRQLSMGYSTDIVLQDGITPDGQKYDAVQTNLKMNHLAVVAQARGGEKLRLGDNGNEDSNMTTRTIVVDGLSVETTEAGAKAIEKLQGDIADAKKENDQAVSDLKQKLADAEKAIATKDAEIDDLKSKVLDDAALDAKVKERADLISVAKGIADKDYSGKTAEEIRSAAVSAKLGDEAIKDKSPEYIQARFDILAEDSRKESHKTVVNSGKVSDGKPSMYEMRLVQGRNFKEA